MQCSILRQSSAAGEQHVPLPELEWIFNGTVISEVRMGNEVVVGRYQK